MIKELSKLGYSDLWMKFGFLTETTLKEQINTFETSEDKSTEHYRYASFKKYLYSKKLLTNDEIDNYLHLAKIDEDEMMAEAAIVDMIFFSDLTDNQFEKVCNALTFFGKSTEKVIIRQTLFRRLKKTVDNESKITEDIFLECLEKGNRVIHEFLICFADRNQMELIAEKGSSKAIRNIAKQRLRSKDFK